MPIGVTVTTRVSPGGGDIDRQAAGTYFVAGLAERGDTTAPIEVRSFGEAIERLGARTTYGSLYDDLETFFAESGGGRAYVARVVGPAATVGNLTLQDRAAVPVNTLRIDAKDAGAWSANVTVEVTDAAITNSFRITVRYKGDIVEVFDNLTSPAAAVLALAASAYVRAVDLASATAPPANNPAVRAATALSAGTDDRAAVTAATLVAALDRFGTALGAGAVAIPGQAHTAVGAGLIAHARARRRIALLAPPALTSVAGAGTAADGLRNTAGAEHAGLFFPWVQVPDGAGGVRTISPEGFVAGVRARTISDAGTWRAPAGAISAARHAVGVERELTQDEVNNLADDHVNSIRLMQASVRLYGWRSLSTETENYRFLTARDVLNELATLGEQVLEQFVFRTIDGRGHLFAEVEGELRRVIEPMRTAGGLYARETNGVDDGGYDIDTGPTVNTPESVGRGEVNAVLAVRVAPTGELINLTISKAAHRASL